MKTSKSRPGGVMAPAPVNVAQQPHSIMIRLMARATAEQARHLVESIAIVPSPQSAQNCYHIVRGRMSQNYQVYRGNNAEFTDTSLNANPHLIPVVNEVQNLFGGRFYELEVERRDNQPVPQAAKQMLSTIVESSFESQITKSIAI